MIDCKMKAFAYMRDGTERDLGEISFTVPDVSFATAGAQNALTSRDDIGLIRGFNYQPLEPLEWALSFASAESK